MLENGGFHGPPVMNKQLVCCNRSTRCPTLLMFKGRAGCWWLWAQVTSDDRREKLPGGKIHHPDPHSSRLLPATFQPTLYTLENPSNRHNVYPVDPPPASMPTKLSHCSVTEPHNRRNPPADHGTTARKTTGHPPRAKRKKKGFVISSQAAASVQRGVPSPSRGEFEPTGR